ncbi:acyltransferase family protein [Enterococcus hulanensis]|uniref:acyltransferase family protein n=1 Tax=Enterococcus hulanensis TaxID=2559929 RepID=UPI0010F9A8C7|nr:acyltransferase [Enterococcus hulanensis]
MKKENYPLLDIAQFCATVLIVLVHCGKLFQYEPLHFFLKNMLCRIAVPLFFVSSGFFFREHTKRDNHYSTIYFKRHFKTYLCWSIFYIPYGLYFIKLVGVPHTLYLPAAAIGFLSFGICYHLWYYPALFLGLFLSKKMQERYSQSATFIVSFFLFCFGACETYSSYLANTFIGNIYEEYHHLFFTTRNGLFFAFVYIVLGFLLSDKRNDPLSRNWLPLKITCSSLLLFIEGLVIYKNPGDDKNFLISTIPLIFFLLSLLVHSEKLKKMNCTHFRVLSRYLFLINPFFIETIKYFFRPKVIQGIPLFTVSLILSFVVSEFIITYKDKLEKHLLSHT